jgi:rhamnose transport system permease protein
MGSWARRSTWELLLGAILVAIVVFDITQSTGYLSVDNFVNLFQLHIEKMIIVIPMTLVIVAGEIDLSVASVMGWSAAVLAATHEHGVTFALAIPLALLAAAAAGLIHGWCVARLGLPSLVVTLAGLIGWRGASRVLMEDRSVGRFPDWFDRLGQDDLVGPIPLALIVFAVILAAGWVVLHYSAAGRRLFVIGDNAEVARYSGVDVVRTRIALFTTSSLIAGLAGILFASRLGTVRGDLGSGFELEIITVVLLGGVSIFGGSGRMSGVLLAILIVLNLRNGFGLANVGGNTQTGVIGAILIGSVLAQNLIEGLGNRSRTRVAAGMRATPPSGGDVAIAGGSEPPGPRSQPTTPGGNNP